MSLFRLSRRKMVSLAGPPLLTPRSLFSDTGANVATAASPAPFAGHTLLAISDADTVAQAYVTDEIGTAIADNDTLSVVTFPADGARPEVTEVEASNSVWGPPATLGVTPDGRYAFVLEVKRQRTADDRSFEEDLEFTTGISVVDLQASSGPQVIQQADSGGFAAHCLSVSPRGDLVAVANWQGPTPDAPDTPPRQISLIPFAEGQLGEPRLFPIVEPAGPFAVPNQIAWHPSGDFLGLTMGPRNAVVFYRIVQETGGVVAAEPWGAPITVGQFPLTAAWTPDGQFFVAAIMEWNDEAGITDAVAPTGSLSVVRFDAVTGEEHAIAHSQVVGINPEGLAISPDGSLIVTVNMQYSHLPADGSEGEPTRSSISLFTFDRASGAMEPVEEQEFDGVLPEGVVFAPDGTGVAVAVFDFSGPEAGRGALKLWEVATDERPGLVALPTEVPLVRGAHSVVLVPN